MPVFHKISEDICGKSDIIYCDIFDILKYEYDEGVEYFRENYGYERNIKTSKEYKELIARNDIEIISETEKIFSQSQAIPSLSGEIPAIPAKWLKIVKYKIKEKNDNGKLKSKFPYRIRSSEQNAEPNGNCKTKSRDYGKSRASKKRCSGVS